MEHETVGEVLAFGPDAEADFKGDLKVGDIALVYPWLGCGKCDVCLAGDENMCRNPIRSAFTATAAMPTT